MQFNAVNAVNAESNAFCARTSASPQIVVYADQQQQLHLPGHPFLILGYPQNNSTLQEYLEKILIIIYHGSTLKELAISRRLVDYTTLHHETRIPLLTLD